MAVQRVSKRTEVGGAGTEKDLLNLCFEAQERTPDLFTKQLVTGLTLTTIHAGSETTAGTLGIALAALLLHPQAYEEVKQEIRTAALSAPPQLSEVRKLAYLEACIKESQRVYPLGLDPLERIVPAEGATVAGVWIPGGTTIAINAAALSQQAQIYDPKSFYPITSFEPKRWIDCTSSQRAEMERASLPFGKSPSFTHVSFRFRSVSYGFSPHVWPTSRPPLSTNPAAFPLFSEPLSIFSKPPKPD